MTRLARHRGFQLAPRAAIGDDAAKRRGAQDGRQFAGQVVRANSERDVRFDDNLLQFAGPQHWHGRDGDGAGLHHGQPGGEHQGRVAAAKQNAIAGHNAQILRQHMAQAVGLGRQFGIAPDRIPFEDRRLFRRDLCQRVVQQPLAAIERVGELQRRQRKFKDGPLIFGRQTFPGKDIAVKGGTNCHKPEFYA